MLLMFFGFNQLSRWLRPAIILDEFHPSFCYPNYVFSPESLLIGALCSLYKIDVKRKKISGETKIEIPVWEHSSLALASHLCWGSNH